MLSPFYHAFIVKCSQCLGQTKYISSQECSRKGSPSSIDAPCHWFQRCGRELGAVLLVELADGVSHMLHQGGGLRMCVNRDWD